MLRKAYPIPKISTTLQELEDFTYATTLDFNMGNYSIRLDPAASKMCSLSLGKVLVSATTHGVWRLSQHIPCSNDGPDGIPRQFVNYN
jgi:hypothetical protein